MQARTRGRLRQRLGRLAGAGTTALLLTACGGGSADEPLVEPSPATVGTISADTAANKVIQDTLAMKAVIDETGAGKANEAIYDLINSAGERDADAGAAMIRKELPALVSALHQPAAETVERLEALQLQTEGGRQLREIEVDLVQSEVALWEQLNADVMRSDRTWGAVLRWGKKNNQFADDVGTRVLAIIQGLPPEDQEAIARALQEVFGI